MGALFIFHKGLHRVKNLTPSTPEWTLESFPREEKSTGPSVHCEDLHMRKKERRKKEKEFALQAPSVIFLRWLLHISYT